MNYLPYVGFWFYGATSGAERANVFASWGMLDDLPASTTPTLLKRITDWFWEFF